MPESPGRYERKSTNFRGNFRLTCPRRRSVWSEKWSLEVQSRGSVRLSEIARSLEENISIKKIIERLGRQLQRGGLREQVRENLLQLAAGRIDSQTLLVVDPTDINKPYAKKIANTWRRFETDRRGGSETVIGVAKWWGPAAAVLRCCRSIRNCTRKKPPTLSAKTMRS